MGYEDETWWSRLTQPRVYAWSEGSQPLRLVQQTYCKGDPDPKALACYGLLVRGGALDGLADEQIWLRFVDGRPVSDITIRFMDWCCTRLQQVGARVLALVWDNASWHLSHAVRRWVHEHNRQVKGTKEGVRILVCTLPVKSPWLNPMEPRWMHGKRRVVEPNRTLSAQELADRICATLGCRHEDHLSIPEKVP